MRLAVQPGLFGHWLCYHHSSRKPNPTSVSLGHHTLQWDRRLLSTSQGGIALSHEHSTKQRSDAILCSMDRVLPTKVALALSVPKANTTTTPREQRLHSRE